MMLGPMYLVDQDSAIEKAVSTSDWQVLTCQIDVYRDSDVMQDVDLEEFADETAKLDALKGIVVILQRVYWKSVLRTLLTGPTLRRKLFKKC